MYEGPSVSLRSLQASWPQKMDTKATIALPIIGADVMWSFSVVPKRRHTIRVIYSLLNWDVPSDLAFRLLFFSFLATRNIFLLFFLDYCVRI